MDYLLGGFISLVGVFSGHIEPSDILSGFCQEGLAWGEGFDLIELVFDYPMRGFDIRLVGVGHWRDGIMHQPFF